MVSFLSVERPGPCHAAHGLASACSKTHAVPGAPAPVWRWRAPGLPPARACDRAGQLRTSLTQGQPCAGWRAALIALCIGLVLSAAAQAAGCPGPRLRFEPLGPGLWRVPAFVGEADAANRGQVSNLVLALGDGAAGGRLWALGSGPSPAFGQALACQARQQLGATLTDIVSPWARPELVLGANGVASEAARRGVVLRHWAHAAVADAMAEQCPRCVDRLRQRLQDASVDLDDPDAPGADPIPLPTDRLTGEQGDLGPFHWWRLPRADGRWVTVWRARSQPLWVAPGLLGDGGPPDGRDADLALMRQSARALATLAAPDGASARFVGEQGPVLDSGAPARHAAYWDTLLTTALAAVERGDDEAAPAPALPGFPASWAGHPWHGFNWQRAWRQVESLVFGAPGP